MFDPCLYWHAQFRGTEVPLRLPPWMALPMPPTAVRCAAAVCESISTQTSSPSAALLGPGRPPPVQELPHTAAAGTGGQVATPEGNAPAVRVAGRPPLGSQQPSIERSSSASPWNVLPQPPRPHHRSVPDCYLGVSGLTPRQTASATAIVRGLASKAAAKTLARANSPVAQQGETTRGKGGAAAPRNDLELPGVGGHRVGKPKLAPNTTKGTSPFREVVL